MNIIIKNYKKLHRINETTQRKKMVLRLNFLVDKEENRI